MLIAFAVALGAVVMNWGKGYIEESGVIPSGEMELEAAEGSLPPCEREIRLQVLTIAGRPDICFDGASNVLNYRFENNGQTAIDGAKMQVIGATDVLETDIGPLAIADIKKGSLSYDPSRYGQVQKAKEVMLTKIEP